MKKTPQLSAEARSRLVKLADEAVGSDHWWEFADGILEEVPDEGAGDPAPSHAERSKNDGTYSELEELSDDILEDLGQIVTVNTLRDLRATARAWTSAERDPEVEFGVHRRLRGSKGQLAVYKRRAAADFKRSPGLVKSPRLTEHRLKNYRADEKPMVPWLEARKKTLRSVAAKATGVASLDQLEVAFRDILAERRKELGG